MIHQALHHALHPALALAEAYRVLRPGGTIVVLDLMAHELEAARDLYGDVWLGFSRVEVLSLLRDAGFAEGEVTIADRAEEAPHFETIMAIARKIDPASSGGKS